jgi:phage-related minor tail protein
VISRLFIFHVEAIKEYYNAGMDDATVNASDDVLVGMLTASGFRITPIQTIIDALASMEEYLRDQTGLDQQHLEQCLDKIESLVGREEALTLELDEIVSWIRAFQLV